jgi:hypothetical protein
LSKWKAPSGYLGFKPAAAIPTLHE